MPDVKIIFTRAAYIQYEQILLDKNFRQYLQTIIKKSQNQTKNGGSKHTDTK